MTGLALNTARDIAEAYGYDQVIIIARKAGEDGGQHINTFGSVKSRHMVMAMTGEFAKFRLDLQGDE